MRRAWESLVGLQWSQPSFWRREYELRSVEELVATMRIRGALRPVAVAECGDGAWTFTRTGFFQKRATIRASGQPTDVAEFHSSWWNSAGELALASGGRFSLGVNFWMTRLEVRTGAGETIMHIHRHGLCGRTADVEIGPVGRGVAELPLLVLFGWFLFVMLVQDAGAVVVTG